MALPAGFQLEQAIQPQSMGLPPGFQLEGEPATPSEIPAARQQQPGFLTQLGRGAASLADVTIGGVLPAVAQQVAYPLARMGRSPQEAQAATERVVGAVDQPFGKAFGVSETPEYQQESGRQIIDFIGQNFQKGAKWIAEKTGVPQSDVENYLGSAAIASPQIFRGVQKVAAPAIEKAVIGAKMPFENQLQARREAASLKDYARGPQIDAIKEAQRLKLALNPTDVQPTTGPKLTSLAAGEKGVEAITAANKNRVREIALKELDLPLTSQLDGDTAYKQSRTQVEKPYREVEKLPIQQADAAMLKKLESIRSDMDVIGAKDYAPAISKIVDDAIAKTQTGLTGEGLLKNIKILRERAKKTYDNKSASTEALDVADTNLKIATELESLIDNSITNPKLLAEFRDARTKMAKSYAYQGATDFNTGLIDVSKLARITAKNNALTGDIASLGKIAGNFPDVFTTKVASPWTKAAELGRTGLAGSLGGLGGYIVGGYPGMAIGSVLSAGAGKAGQSFAAGRISSPGYQAGLQLSDARIPVNQLGAAMQPAAASNAMVPYQIQGDVLAPGEGPYRPNFTVQPNQYPPRASFVGPEAGPRQLGMSQEPAGGGQTAALRAEDARLRSMYEARDLQAQAAAAQAEAASRQPTRGGTPLVFDERGRLIPENETLRGATPDIQVIESTGKNLSGAAELLASGKPRALMSAEQRIAWEKTKVDLADAVPGMKALNEKALADKLMDRQWVEGAIVKAREKAAAFDEMSKRATNAQLIRDAAIKREQMLDAVEALESQLSSARPVQRGSQGPKTQAAQRNKNALSPTEAEIKNALTPRIDLRGMNPERPR
jgi:hypothetical protein